VALSSDDFMIPLLAAGCWSPMGIFSNQRHELHKHYRLVTGRLFSLHVDVLRSDSTLGSGFQGLFVKAAKPTSLSGRSLRLVRVSMLPQEHEPRKYNELASHRTGIGLLSSQSSPRLPSFTRCEIGSYDGEITGRTRPRSIIAGGILFFPASNPISSCAR
jgi:hypothetical protein